MQRRFFTKLLLAAPAISATQSFAQTKAGEAMLDATGGWIHYLSNNSSYRVYNHLGPGDAGFPTMSIFGGLGTAAPNAALAAKLKTLQAIFQSACPKPQGHCLTYGISTRKDVPESQPRFVIFSINAKGLESDGKGGVAPINVAASQGSTRFAGKAPNYDGLVSVVLNDVSPKPEYKFFTRLTQFDALLATKAIPNMSGVYLRPPSVVNTRTTGPGQPLPASLQALVDSKTVHVFSYTHIGDGYDMGSKVEQHMQKIILSSYARMPYVPIRRGALLELLKLQTLHEAQQFQTRHDADLAKGGLTAKQISDRAEVFHRYDLDQQVIAKLTELNATQAELPAILRSSEVGILTGLNPYWRDDRGRESINLARMNDVFIDDPLQGYTPCRRVRTYRSTKEEDIQTLMVNWYYELPVAGSPKAAEHPNLDPRSLHASLGKNLAWDQLANLVMSPQAALAVPATFATTAAS